jgi:hypothetical protein
MQHKTLAHANALALLSLTLWQPKAPAQTLLKPQSAQVALGSLPMRAMWALESNDLPTLAKMAHSKGVRFSPYVAPEAGDKRFTPRQIRTLNRGNKYLWGSYDGSGDPIRMSWAAYHKSFVWPRDFSKGKLSFNTFTHRGNTINQLKSAYPGAIFVESYLPGADPKYGGMDWAGLWTIWQREGKAWKLAGIAHDQWTI